MKSVLNEEALRLAAQREIEESQSTIGAGTYMGSIEGQKPWPSNAKRRDTNLPDPAMAGLNCSAEKQELGH